MRGVPKLYMYSAKGVAAEEARGMAAARDRVFLVVGNVGSSAVAWKCFLWPQGLSHPAFAEHDLLPLTEEGLRRGSLKSGDNGAMPTAVFRPDSLYRPVTLENLRDIVRGQPVKEDR